MSWQYREVKVEYNSEKEDNDQDSDESDQIGYRPRENNQSEMEAANLKALIEGAVNSALVQQERRLKDEFRAEIAAVRNQVETLRVEAPQVERYERVTCDPNIKCEVKLDIVKSVPTFNGSHEEYVSWRQAAVDAYEIFKRYIGSEAHYEAVAILKNKVCGAARAVLTSHNTVLNFDAIIARLDCTYADKTSLRVLRQQLEMVRQGDLDLMDYYDEVEKKLTLVTNKIVMTHDEQAATILNTEIRSDALHAFMAGLKRSLKSYVIPAQPKDLPSALALAREAESSIERSAFAASYAKAIEDKGHTGESNRQGRNAQPRQGKGFEKNPHFVVKQNQSRPHTEPGTKPNDKESPVLNQVQPMEVDPSVSKFRQPTNWRQPNNATHGETQKRQNTSERISGQRRQRVNNVSQQAGSKEEQEYASTAEAATNDIDEESDSSEINDSLNFLGNAPSCRSSSDNWMAEH